MPKVYGQTVDHETRCTHYHGETDIIAIKFRCCGKYYPCYQCHDEEEDHERIVWEKEAFDTKAILCGHCGYEHTINEYLHTYHCVKCQADFNPGCSLHYPLYFETRVG
ncbi:hypothetical protein GCM10011391_10450 [Pullulanibacillus camelliae]|uniref:CHY-type domain-containing protein n=1 Tax=Pullulanibacillus camelliae TaxID=1707096 RepID=A0A8J2VK15_9BACL|nr:CHY zinc finger protein [Pullulanibacillus camelliae]GGE33657.1 hypothetical protein GCM10011391_10450 [Pullulanibacillus camelliae]